MDQHRSRFNRRLHVVGSLSTVALFFYAVWSGKGGLFYWLPVTGYLPAWVGHFIIEKNRPATFDHPFYSLRGDARMVKKILQNPSLF